MAEIGASSSAVHLLLKSGPADRLSWLDLLNFIFVFLPGIFVSVPIACLWHHLILRSPIVSTIGRPFFTDLAIRISRFYLSRATPAQARILFNRTRAYETAFDGPAFKGFKEWVSYVEVNGTAGRWIGPPGRDRSEDDVVLYFIHGGGFVFDSGAGGQPWLIETAKELNLKCNIKFSAFSLDYRLAPEHVYPSQLIEILAGYHHLVNTVGISPSKICLGGDSAGGCLVSAFLLHLARPNPIISVPISLGPTPSRPGAALLISPFIKLISHLPSRKLNSDFDCIESNQSWAVTFDYIGVPLVKTVPSWNPWHLIVSPGTEPPRDLVKPIIGYKPEMEHQLKDAELLSSPYVNPSVVCEDLDWWKIALPGAGRTMVVWGGKEIFADDVEEFVAILKLAEVTPKTLVKELGVHDWLLLDSSVPGLYKTKSTGDQAAQNFGVISTANFLQTLVVAKD